MDGATVADDARIIGGTTIGAGAQVGAGALVDGSIVFGRARIGDGARITRSVIGTGAVVGARAVITDAVIGDDAIIGADNELISGVRVWPGVSIPTAACGSRLHPEARTVGPGDPARSGQRIRNASPVPAAGRGWSGPAGWPMPIVPSGSQSSGRPSTDRTTTGAKMVEEIQAEPSPSAARATNSACTAAPPATVNMVRSASRRRWSG